MKTLIFILAAGLFALGKSQSQTNSLNSQKNPQAFFQFLPPPIFSIELGKSSVDQIISAIGNPLKIDEHNNHYYNLKGLNYDTTIGINKKGKVSYILYTPPAGSLTLIDLKPYIPDGVFKKYLESPPPPNHLSHTLEQTVDLVVFDKVIVQSGSNQSVKSILLLE